MHASLPVVPPLLAVVLACAPHGQITPRASDAAVSHVQDRELAALLDDHWQWYLASAPVFASTAGDHRYDDRIDDNSLAAQKAARATKRGFLTRARLLDAADLGDDDRVTLALFVELLVTDLAGEVCSFETWSVSVADNPVTTWNVLPDEHHVTSVGDGRNLVARYRAIPRWIDTAAANLRQGAKDGLTANVETTRRVIAMIDAQLTQPTASWPLLAPALAERPSWPAADRLAFTRDVNEAIELAIRPALARYRETLAGEILPRARDDEHVGIGALPMGTTCYRSQIRAFTSLELGPAELHALGLAELTRIHGEMLPLGERLFGTHELPSILLRLRGDPALFFATEEQVEERAKSALAAAKAALPRVFGVLPKTDCVVSRLPGYEAAFSTIAYYRPPYADGSKPGEYVVNVTAPSTRPRYEAEALAFHEGIPGHHVQIAIAQELGSVPAFRKFLGTTSFVEGWALYAELLADEMGLYSGDLARLGRLGYETWRAARLVVDTGIHSMGWSRERAVQFLLANTTLAENNIRNEVDRYIVWPGQALAYKVGQLEILRLRSWAQGELGASFDLRGFHDAVLLGGAVTLPILEDRVKRWVAAARR